jgi:hypothetical protein
MKSTSQHRKTPLKDIQESILILHKSVLFRGRNAVKTQKKQDVELESHRSARSFRKDYIAKALATVVVTIIRQPHLGDFAVLAKRLLQALTQRILVKSDVEALDKRRLAVTLRAVATSATAIPI